MIHLKNTKWIVYPFPNRMSSVDKMRSERQEEVSKSNVVETEITAGTSEGIQRDKIITGDCIILHRIAEECETLDTENKDGNPKRSSLLKVGLSEDENSTTSAVDSPFPENDQKIAEKENDDVTMAGQKSVEEQSVKINEEIKPNEFCGKNKERKAGSLQLVLLKDFRGTK